MQDQRERREVKIAGWLESRKRALAMGDRGLARSITADLNRIGYQEPALETVSAPGLPEAATPPKARRARAPRGV